MFFYVKLKKATSHDDTGQTVQLFLCNPLLLLWPEQLFLSNWRNTQ